MNIDRLHEILQKGLADEAYPCFAAVVGDKNGIAYRELAGNRAIYPEKLPLTEDTYASRAGGNIVLTSNGMDIYNGTTKLATYGSSTLFYIGYGCVF